MNQPETRTRPAHAEGVFTTGRFVPALSPYDDQAVLTARCCAPCLTAEEPITAVVRFSNFRLKGWKRRPDIRGMACRLTTSDSELDLVAMTSPRFLVRREEDYHRLGRSPASAPRLLWRLLVMIPSRRTTFTALAQLIVLTRLRPVPRRGLTGSRYFGVHTFWLEDDRGSRRAVRYHWRPAGPRPPRAGNELHRQLASQIANGNEQNRPVAFDLVVDLFDDPVPYRKTNDPLRRYPGFVRELWPFSRFTRWAGTTRIVAGQLTLDAYLGTDYPAARQWVFNPVPATEGFLPSDDEILLARGAAYVASHVRRSDPPQAAG